MFQENEILTLLLASAVLAFILASLKHIRRIRYWHLLLAAFFSFYIGALATVIEGVIAWQIMNFLEHIGATASALLIIYWYFKAYVFSEARS